MLDDRTVQSIINQLNQAQPRYATNQEQLAWQQGVLIAVLAYAIRNDSNVGHRLSRVIEQHNKRLGG